MWLEPSCQTRSKAGSTSRRKVNSAYRNSRPPRWSRQDIHTTNSSRHRRNSVCPAAHPPVYQSPIPNILNAIILNTFCNGCNTGLQRGSCSIHTRRQPFFSICLNMYASPKADRITRGTWCAIDKPVNTVADKRRSNLHTPYSNNT